jgi:hypothetical protein
MSMLLETFNSKLGCLWEKERIFYNLFVDIFATLLWADLNFNKRIIMVEAIEKI